MTKRSRGSILVQVLILGALLLILVTLLVRAVTQNYHIGAYLTGEYRETKNAQASIAAVQSVWTNATVGAGGAIQYCASGGGSNGTVTCSGTTVGTCGCTCQVFIMPPLPNPQTLVRYPDVKSTLTGTVCQIQTDLTNLGGQYTFP